MAFWVGRRFSSGLHFVVYRAMHIGFPFFADLLVAGVAVRVVRVALRVLTNEKPCHAAPPV